ncbi:MAG: hypothetical protein GF331_05270 [Chitinivibrionales bacterium]|nr:hypothetical protein [Chitinivibrionales bacterium]
MKRLYGIYALVVVGLLMAGIAAVQLVHGRGAGAALRKLGKGKREYLEARQELLLKVTDPAGPLLRFAADRSRSLRARVQALEILEELSFHQEIPDAGRYLAPLLAEDSRELQLQTLVTLEHAKSLEGLETLAEFLREQTDSALFQRCYAAVIAGVEPLHKRIREAIHWADTTALDSCLKVLHRLPVGKAPIYPDLARWYRSRSDFARATEYYRRIGVVKPWWVCGPFDNARFQGFLREYPPETRPFSPTDTFDLGGGRQAAWFPMGRVAANGEIDIGRLFRENRQVVAYFFTYVHAPTARDALLLCGSDDAIRVWVNDSLVWSHKEFRSAVMDDDAVRVRLEKGANKLLVKVAQHMGGWGLVCRLSGSDGEAMPDVAFSMTPKLVPNSVAGLLDRLQTGGINWRHVLDSVDVEDHRLIQSVFAEVNDNSAPEKRRVRALHLLEQFNNRRSVPAGELELIDLLSRAAREGSFGEVHAYAATMLVRMGSRRTLDIGMKLREARAPAARYWGNRLVGGYCRSRLIALGDPTDPEREALIHRTVQELESLKPTDAWVRERLSSLHLAAGDTTDAVELLADLTMPPVWIARGDIPKKQVDHRKPPFIKNPDMLPAAGTLDSLAGPPPLDGWERLTHGGDTLGVDAVCIRIAPTAMPGEVQGASLLCTEVYADTADSVRINVAFGAFWMLFVNGEHVGGIRSFGRNHYDLGDRYPWQRLNLEVDSEPVKLRKGINTIVLLMPMNYWLTDTDKRFLRCSFAEMDGTPITVEGKVLRRQMGSDHG